MAARAKKVAFSLEASLLSRVERLRRATGESRSALISRALRSLSATDEHEQRVSRYIAAYREKPESPSEIEAARMAAKSVLAQLPWDD
jgi:metal-responsive CopG/Arc/MetJ family transcriptional regulator